MAQNPDQKNRVIDLLRKIVVLTKDQKDELLEKIDVMNDDQLNRTEKALQEAFRKQTEILKKAYVKDPAFVAKTMKFEEGQIKRMYTEAMHIGGRKVLQNLFKQKQKWLKKP